MGKGVRNWAREKIRNMRDLVSFLDRFHPVVNTCQD